MVEDGGDPFAEGVEAHDAGVPETDNPHAGGDLDAEASWNDGWALAAGRVEGAGR